MGHIKISRESYQYILEGISRYLVRHIKIARETERIKIFRETYENIS